jgi:hypothetical protein
MQVSEKPKALESEKNYSTAVKQSLEKIGNKVGKLFNKEGSETPKFTSGVVNKTQEKGRGR